MYLDCADAPPTAADGHIYLSYIGTKKVRESHLRKGYKICAGVPTVIIDTLWLNKDKTLHRASGEVEQPGNRRARRKPAPTQRL